MSAGDTAGSRGKPQGIPVTIVARDMDLARHIRGRDPSSLERLHANRAEEHGGLEEGGMILNSSHMLLSFAVIGYQA